MVIVFFFYYYRLYGALCSGAPMFSSRSIYISAFLISCTFLFSYSYFCQKEDGSFNMFHGKLEEGTYHLVFEKEADTLIPIYQRLGFTRFVTANSTQLGHYLGRYLQKYLDEISIGNLRFVYNSRKNSLDDFADYDEKGNKLDKRRFKIILKPVSTVVRSRFLGEAVSNKIERDKYNEKDRGTIRLYYKNLKNIDAFTTLQHELLHLAGLGHTFAGSESRLMYWLFRKNQRVSEDDLLGLQALYNPVKFERFNKSNTRLFIIDSTKSKQELKLSIMPNLYDLKANIHLENKESPLKNIFPVTGNRKYAIKTNFFRSVNLTLSFYLKSLPQKKKFRLKLFAEGLEDYQLSIKNKKGEKLYKVFLYAEK